MVTTSPLLGAIVLVGLPPCMLVVAPLWRPYERRATRQQERLAEASGVAADTVSGPRVVKGLGGEPAARAWFAEGTAGIRHSAVAVARLGAAWEALSALVPGVFLAAVVWAGGRLALDGTLSPGELVAFAGLAMFLAIPLATFAEVGDARRLVGGLELCSVTHGALAGLDLDLGPASWSPWPPPNRPSPPRWSTCWLAGPIRLRAPSSSEGSMPERSHSTGCGATWWWSTGTTRGW
jgi:hypothetical protein